MSKDEKFYGATVALAQASLAHRGGNDGQKAGYTEEAQKHLANLGIAKIGNAFESRELRGLAQYVQEAVVDPRSTIEVDGEQVRVPLGTLRALQNALEVDSEENKRILNTFISTRYDTAGSVLKAEGFLAEAGVSVDRGSMSPGYFNYLVSNLKQIAAKQEREAEGFQAQREASGLRELASKLSEHSEKMHNGGGRNKDEDGKNRKVHSTSSEGASEATVGDTVDVNAVKAAMGDAIAHAEAEAAARDNA